MKIFKVLDIDQHYIIYLFGVRLFSIKHKHVCEVPLVKEPGVTSVARTPKIVVSLTSFPKRMPTLAVTLRTVLSQTLKPDLIVLWLSESQFPNKNLPSDILKLQDFGLTIKWCEDMRSYKKLIPALADYPDDIIITLDDDTCYASNTVETLYQSYLRYPQDVHAHRCGRVKLKNGVIKNVPSCYLFDKDFHDASFLNRLTGHAGVLYPPHVFFEDICKREIFESILPTHDDVYFWAMLVLNRVKTRVVKGFSESVYPVENSQESGLCKINRSNSQYGISINEAYCRIAKAYPQIVDILAESLLDDGTQKY